MKTYEELLADLAAMKDERYRVFNERIVNVPAGSSVGVRTPLLRDYGKKLVKGDGFDLDLLLSFPNDRSATYDIYHTLFFLSCKDLFQLLRSFFLISPSQKSSH